jgi:SGNH domain (fused to AT3 domains)
MPGGRPRRLASARQVLAGPAPSGVGDQVRAVAAPAVAPRMTPAQARADDAEPRACMVGFESVTVAPCRFGDPAGRTVVVLLGDSHAGHWFVALDRIARAHGWQLFFWGKSGCGYAEVAQWLASYRREYVECARWRSGVLARVAALPRVDAVVIGRNDSQLGKVAQGGAAVSDRVAAAALWREGATRTLTALRSRAGAVALLRDTPQPDGDVPACLSAHPDAPRACAYPRAGHAEPDGPLLAVEQPALAAAGVAVVQVSDLVCPTDPCPVVSGQGAVEFRDASHLTATFARELAPALTRRLLQAIGLG